MAVSNELAKPDNEDEFEAMCHKLYGSMWRDPTCSRVGGSGQGQFGIDIIGDYSGRTIGVQCKHYNKKPFALSVITHDVGLADGADELRIDHLIFATTAANKTELVLAVRQFSEQRRRDGKFTVSVDFWDAICGHLRVHPEVGKAFIRNFPGAPMLEIRDTTAEHLSLYGEDRLAVQQFQTTVLEGQQQLGQQIAIIADAVNARRSQTAAPTARGDEADVRIAATLDLIRDRIREGKCRDAAKLLASLGDPAQFADQYSRFRWYTNHAAVVLLEGRKTEAADEFIKAFELAPDSEKAHHNRIHAYLLQDAIETAATACDTALAQFAENSPLWALRLNIRMLQGDAVSDRGLPEDLREKPDILFMLAHIAERRGDSPAAVDLLQRCLAIDADSFEAKRAYLASSLAWVAGDPVLSHYGQFSGAQRAALVDAVARVEPLEQVLPAIESDHVSLEVTNNIVLALHLLGEIDRSRTLATLLLRRHPLSEGLLRIRLNQLEERKDFVAIRALTDSHLRELAPSVLAILAEITANHGELAWHAEVMAAAEACPLCEPDKLAELRALRLHALWVSGARDEALAQTEAYLHAEPERILPRSMVGNMLVKLGRRDEALLRANEFAQQSGIGASSLAVLQVADLYFELGEYREAAAFFARLVKVPNNDDFTRKWLICLIESDQRRRAQEVLDQLPPALREMQPFVRIEANLARRTGNWRLLRDLLRKEISGTTVDSGVAVGYLLALHRLGETDTLKGYLGTDPQYAPGRAQNEFEIAKYQGFYGFPALAIRRLYRLYQSNVGSTEAASFYLGQILVGTLQEELKPPEAVRPGALIQLRTVADTRRIVIDLDGGPATPSWPELIAPDTPLAQRLMGLKVGESVTLPGPFGGDVAEIVAIGSLYSFVAEKAHAQVSSAAAPAGPLWSVRLIKDDGEPDIEKLFESARSRNLQVRQAFDTYRQHRIPVTMLAKAIGCDPVTLVTEWPKDQATLFVGIGTQEEREAAISILQSGGKRYVLDLLTIAELTKRRVFAAAVRVLGTPLVPQTVRDHLLSLQDSASTFQDSALIREDGGRLQIVETSADYYQDSARLLQAMLSHIDTRCEVVTTLGPAEITSTHAVMATALDADTLDAVYLAAERAAVLVTEDGALRLLAPQAGVPLSIGVQPILMEALRLENIHHDAYADTIIGKLVDGHDFISIRADDLRCIAARTPNQVANGVAMAFETFRSPSLEIGSGVRVACEFLRGSSHRLKPAVLAKYGRIALDALQFGRSALDYDIHRLIARALHGAAKPRGRKLSAHERRLFSSLLTVPDRPHTTLRLSPIAEALRALFHRRRSRTIPD